MNSKKTIDLMRYAALCLSLTQHRRSLTYSPSSISIPSPLPPSAAAPVHHRRCPLSVLTLSPSRRPTTALPLSHSRCRFDSITSATFYYIHHKLANAWKQWQGVLEPSRG
ncbi:hypothetical protein QL285_002944 [Trifolium repens]|nr:hypothetical protein QL285_002944 [Trifolium repens]